MVKVLYTKNTKLPDIPQEYKAPPHTVWKRIMNLQSVHGCVQYTATTRHMNTSTIKEYLNLLVTVRHMNTNTSATKLRKISTVQTYECHKTHMGNAEFSKFLPNHETRQVEFYHFSTSVRHRIEPVLVTIRQNCQKKAV